MIQKLLDKAENIAKEKNVDLEEELEIIKLEKEQNKFINTNLGKAINGGIDIGLKIILPDCVEDEIISIKDSLVTEGFSAAVDTAIEEATNVGKSLTGILTGTFENMSQVKKAIEKGGLVDSISELLDTGIDWAKKHSYIKKEVATAIKKGKDTVMKNIKNGIDNTLENQVEAIEKLDGYINKWEQYYNEQNFTNMEYQYSKIQEYIQEVLPIEKTLKKAREIENLHKLIKNNGKNFDISTQEKELAGLLAN